MMARRVQSWFIISSRGTQAMNRLRNAQPASLSALMLVTAGVQVTCMSLLARRMGR